MHTKLFLGQIPGLAKWLVTGFWNADLIITRSLSWAAGSSRLLVVLCRSWTEDDWLWNPLQNIKMRRKLFPLGGWQDGWERGHPSIYCHHLSCSQGCGGGGGLGSWAAAPSYLRSRVELHPGKVTSLWSRVLESNSEWSSCWARSLRRSIKGLCYYGCFIPAGIGLIDLNKSNQFRRANLMF